ncbi:MAG: hypothetical protein HQM02_03165, partial [Magnetococcales bacterium]|nr:hypothetical protein [Magnetococcales bacterium]
MKPEGRRSGWVRRLCSLWINSIFFLIFFTAPILFSLAVSPPDLTPCLGPVSRFLSRQTGLDIRVNGLTLQTGLSLAMVGQGVEIRHPDNETPLFDVRRILLRVSPLSWRQGWLSTSLTLEGANLTVRRRGDGELLLADRGVETMLSGTKSGSSRIPMTAISLQDATVTWEDESVQERERPLRTRLTGVHATAFVELDGSAHFTAEGRLPDIQPQTRWFAKGERDHQNFWSLRMQVEGLLLSPFAPYLKRLPPLDGLTPPLDLDVIAQRSASGLRAQWQANIGSGSLAWPAVFRWPLPITSLKADGLLEQTGSLWNLEVKRFDLTSVHGQAGGRMTLTGLGGAESPHLELTATASGTRTDQAKFYYPTRIMHPPLVKWLDNNLKEGQVTRASAHIRGRLVNIPAGPRDPREDLFHIEGEVTGLSLHYFPPLLPLSRITTHLIFDRYGMTAQVPSALFGETRKVSGEVRIANMLDNPTVEIVAESPHVELQSIWKEIVAHPLLRWDRAVGMEGATLTGQGVGGMKLTLPLESLGKMTYSGRLELKKANFHPPFLPLPLEDASGLLTLDAE